jgi:hypothetical protein
MKPIEKFIRDNYTPTIVENKLGLSCLFKHKEGLTEDDGLIDHGCHGVVFFELPMKGWSKKPIVSNRQFMIVDADTTDLLDFLSKYYNLEKEDYSEIRSIIVQLSTEAIHSHYGEN